MPAAGPVLAWAPVTRKSIATNMAVVACDVCGRTLLRGENADVFLYGGSPRTVCELCTARARHEGWIREGVDGGSMPGRVNERGSAARTLLGRLRHRREARLQETGLETSAPEPLDVADETAVREPAPPEAPRAHVEPVMPDAPLLAPEAQAARESRSVHAIPTNAEMKVSRALEVFNTSPHPRTVAGVARSLGAPIVSARPSLTEGAIVTIVVGWELSWYRYEVDLGDEAAGVRVSGQGAELSELEPADQSPNAAADGRGELHLVAGVA